MSPVVPPPDENAPTHHAEPGWSAGSSMPRLSGLELDDLLEELRARAGSARASQERLSALLDAVVAVSSDLELATVLHRIVVSACQLVDATYGALGVLGVSGEHLVEFVTHGVTEEERAAIGPLPHGHGLLGLIIRSPHPQRVDVIAEHTDSYGFPPNHPPMTSFLGAPVRIRDQVFGNLYLTDKRGAPGFTEDDEAILVALAAAAGVAIENARLYDRSVAQHRWAEISREVTAGLLLGRPEGEVLGEAAERVLSLSAADFCTISLSEGTELVAAAAAGKAPVEVGTVTDDPQWRAALASSRPISVDATGVTLYPLSLGERRALGLLAVGNAAADGDSEGGELTDFAQRLSVALAAAGAQRERARAELFEDRDRIARDMHDHVIQRLFATGLSLQSAARLSGDQPVKERLDSAVDELDAAIKDIRHTIFALHRAPGPRNLTAEISEVCQAAIVTLGFAPGLTIRGSTAEVPEQVAADLLAVIREGLSNAARHAAAREVNVSVEVDSRVAVRVADDGRGVPPGVTRSGLQNLGRRAETRGGSFALESAAGGGTVLTWSVPLQSGAQRA